MAYGSDIYHFTPFDEKRKARPGFGSKHPITYEEGANRGLRNIFAELHGLWAAILPHRQVGDPLEEMYREQFTVFDKPHRLGVTVVESRSIREFTERQRRLWTTDDAGNFMVEVEDALGRLGIQQPEILVTYDGVVQVGKEDANGGKRKLAVLIDVGCEAAELLPAEHKIVVGQIESRFPGYKYPHEPEKYMGKLSLGVVHHGVSPSDTRECIEAAQSLFPLDGVLMPIHNFSDSIG